MSTVQEATYELLRSFKMTKVFGNPGSTELPFLRGFPEDFTPVVVLGVCVPVDRTPSVQVAGRGGVCGRCGRRPP